MIDISFLSTVPAEQISFVEEGNVIVKAIKKGLCKTHFLLPTEACLVFVFQKFQSTVLLGLSAV
jgi:hypothetical protein